MLSTVMQSTTYLLLFVWVLVRKIRADINKNAHSFFFFPKLRNQTHTFFVCGKSPNSKNDSESDLGPEFLPPSRDLTHIHFLQTIKKVYTHW